MKLFDKIKELFMDEVDVDDEIEIEEEEEKIVKPEPKVKKEENVLPKVMRDTIKKEEKIQLRSEKNINDNIDLSEISKKQPEPIKKFNFPFDFDLDEPARNSSNRENVTEVPTRERLDLHAKKEEFEKKPTKNINVVDYEKKATSKLNELYAKKEPVEEKPKFKATPVISPVYGILDKNYKKDEVKERNEEMVEMKRPSKKVDFETVRKKAFGNLADDIKDNLLCENCELYKEVKKISQLKEDDLLYDMTVEDEKEVTIEKAYDNYAEFGVAYEPKSVKKEVANEIVQPITKEENKENEDIHLDDIINNVNKVDEAVINDSNDELDDFITKEKPSMTFDSKIDDDVENNDMDNKEDVPSRSEKKKDEKVDEDFFELIDSMYKERTDD